MSDTRTVLFIVRTLPLDALGRVVVDLINHLDRSRWHPVVACLASEGVLADELRNAPLHVFNKKRGIDLLTANALQALARAVRPDLICSHGWSGNLWSRLVLANVGAPLIAVEHARDTWKRAYHRFIDRQLSRRCEVVVATTEDVAEFVRQTVGVPPRRLRVLPVGVDVNRLGAGEGWRVRAELNIPETAPVVATVAHLDRYEHVDRLMEAMIAVHARLPQAILLIAGNGPLRETLEAKAEQFGLLRQVRFAGERRDLPDVLAAANLFALSSDEEGRPLAALEAQAAGLPVVLATNRPAAKTLAGEAGCAVPTTATDMADGLLRLLNDLEVLKGMGAYAQHYARTRFDLPAMLRRYESLFDELVRA